MYFSLSRVEKLHKRFMSERANAYFTIELSLIFPIILLTIVVVVHWTFMLYGRTILSQDAYLLALRGAITSRDSPESYAGEHAAEQFWNWYLGNDTPSCNAAKNEGSKMVRVLLSTETRHKGTSFYGFRANGDWDYSIEWQASYRRPAETVRLFTRIYDLYMIGADYVEGELRGEE